ncbi:MAG: hypothetical protein GOV00_00320 [Candidatus Altiarchaeota archaeon]|nr:hypothetical protein [Candidatus Altiarchaeota archaeon]
MWSIKRFFSQLGQKLSLSEKIYHSPEIKYAHKKEKKMAIVKLKSSKDLIKIRKYIQECDAVFIGIRGARRDELSHNVTQIKATARQQNKKVYGVDPSWIVISSFEQEK